MTGMGSDSAVERVADELYAGLPSDFTAGRDAAVRTARAAGDKDLAAALAKLRKPTAGAWLGNLLAHHHADAVAQLVALGGEMRAAQAQLNATQLRTLSQRRTQVIRDLVALARRNASDLDQTAGPAAIQELEATLAAAVADESAGLALTAGRLTQALSYSGFGLPMSPSDAASSPAPPARSAPRKSGTATATDPKIDAAERDLAQARLQLAHAEADAAKADAEATAATRTIDDLETLLTDLRAELEAAEQALAATRGKLSVATVDGAVAKADAKQAARAVAAAERTLTRLRG
jgi:hypothetical protein